MVSRISPPFVDQVRRRDDKEAPVAFAPVEHGGDGDRHHRFARTHFGIDDACRLAIIDQQSRDSLNHAALCRERLALEILRHRVAAVVEGSVVDRRILLGDGSEQAVAEVRDELGEWNDTGIVRGRRIVGGWAQQGAAVSCED